MPYEHLTLPELARDLARAIAGRDARQDAGVGDNLMLPEHVARLLQDIDRIECDLRHCEVRLTRIRERLHEALLGGEQFSRYDVDGQPKQAKAPRRGGIADGAI